MPRKHAIHPVLMIAVAAMGLGIAFEFLRALTDVGGRSLYWFSTSYVYTAVEWIAVAVAAARAVLRSEDRLAWALVAVALGLWSAGDLVWTLWLNYVADPPFPSIADAFYLLMYPVLWVALMLLIRARMRRAGTAQWLDGIVVGLAVAAVAAALVFSTVVGATHGEFVADAVNVAYPVGDFVLLSFVAVAFSLANWKPGHTWLVVGSGVFVCAGADILYLVQAANGNYTDPAVLNALYLLSFSLLAVAGWVPRSGRVAARTEAPQTIILAALAAAVALALLVVGSLTQINPLAVALAAGALLAACARAALTYVENVRMLRASAQEAVTDHLSGLGNRRRLMTDLEEACARAGAIEAVDARVLRPQRLQGLQRQLRSRGGRRAAGSDRGVAAGCGRPRRAHVPARRRRVLRAAGRPGPARRSSDRRDQPRARRARQRLHRRRVARSRADPRRCGHRRAASCRLADERMYAAKSRASRAQTRDVLLALLDERAPEMREDIDTVAELARAVSHELGLDAEELDRVLRAAELHDIGKLAIPDEILHKPGPLEGKEWEFMKQHAAIGERILCASPALTPVARIVRAAHERWDGHGYPDRLAGDRDSARLTGDRRLRRVRIDDLGSVLPPEAHA